MSAERQTILGCSEDCDFASKLIVTEGTKTDDGIATMYKVKQEKRNAVVQFGIGVKSGVPLGLLRFPGGDQPVLKVGFPSDSLLEKNIVELERSIGKKLFAAKDVYFNGQLKPDMTEDEFLELGTKLIRADKLTSEPQIFLKTRKWSKMYSMRNKDGQDGVFVRSRITPEAYEGRSYLSFTGVASCIVGVHVGMIKGSPRWGLYLSVQESYMVPQEMAAAAGPLTTGCALGEGITVEDEPSDDEQDDDEAGNDLLLSPPKRKRAAAMEAPGAPRRKVKGGAPGFVPPKNL